MSRRITSELHQATAAPGARVDGYFDRVIKYIPSDVVGAWVAVTGIIPKDSAPGGSAKAVWIAFAFGAVFTAFWMWKQTNLPERPAPITQVAISTLAFVVWVFALGEPFTSLSWYQPYLGSLALIGYSLLAGLIVPKE